MKLIWNPYKYATTGKLVVIDSHMFALVLRRLEFKFPALNMAYARRDVADVAFLLSRCCYHQPYNQRLPVYVSIALDVYAFVGRFSVKVLGIVANGCFQVLL